MAFFECVSGSSGGGATITVTYSSDFYGETVTCSHGTKTYSKVATSSGTLEFSVDEEGTWTISCTIGSDTFTTTADVDLTYDAELVSLPNGETVLPTDDIETWLACAAITDKAYTTLSQVLGDSETYNALLGDSNACAYMKRSTTWSTDICASQYAMNLLGQYDTVCDALLSDSTWASAIANSTYFESVLNVKVPVMTGNTTPEGECISTSEFSGRYTYYAFSRENTPSTSVNTIWLSNQQTTPVYIGYKFTEPIVVNKIKVMFALASGTTNTSTTFTVQGSDTGNSDDWHDISSAITDTATSIQEYDFVNNTPYLYHRINITEQTLSGASYKGAVNILQFYGRHVGAEKIHGGNPTYDSFYRIVDGNNVPVTDPSLLDEGTYTIYSNGLAKNLSDLTSDYGKTIRICPNTKEIVVRHDNALYWWGYKAGRCEELSTANGWSRSSMSFVSPTFDNTKVTITGASSTYCGIATKYSVRSAKAYAIVTTTTSASENRFMGANTSKVLVPDTSFPYRTMLTSIETNAKENLTMNASEDLYAGVISLGNYPVAVSAFVLE